MGLSPHKLSCSFCLAIALTLTGCASVSHQASALTKPGHLETVAELSMRDFYKLPVGPYGLEPSDKLLNAKDQKVRIKGYMVQEEEPTPGLFMLSLMPVNIPEKEDGPSDDLPGSTLFVHMSAEDAGKVLAYRPGIWELVGTLKLGSQEEANGRVSYVRLMLDQPLSLDAVKPESRADAN